jgi:hypothetical protein
MINQEELAICGRRGHVISIIDERWSKCKACGMWVRETTTIEERQDNPPENELEPMFAILTRLNKVRIDEHRLNPDEFAICKRRGHVPKFPSDDGWSPCSACGTWLRERRTIEEREDKPSDN